MIDRWKPHGNDLIAAEINSSGELIIWTVGYKPRLIWMDDDYRCHAPEWALIMVLELARAQATGTAHGNQFRHREAVHDYWVKHDIWVSNTDGTEYHFENGQSRGMITMTGFIGPMKMQVARNVAVTPVDPA
jgi:hypothetical protein